MSKGKSIVEFYNLLPLDAAAIGNHELDFGPDVPARVQVLPGEDGMGNLKARVREARFPWLSCNMILDPPRQCVPGPKCNALGQRTVFEPRIILKRAGYKVCVIGATTTETPGITQAAFIQGTSFVPLVSSLEAEAKFLREKEGCDYVLLTAHEGLVLGVNGKYLPGVGMAGILESLTPSLLDAVAAGHIHVPAQAVINGIPVMQEGRSAKEVGVLHLSGMGKERTHRFEAFIDVPATAVEPSVTAVLKPYREEAARYKNMIVGKAAGAFLASHRTENPLGNMVCDAVFYSGGKQGEADFALMNAGGIRNDLAAGDVAYEEIFSVMPFDNDLTIVQLTGSQIRRILEIATSGEVGMPAVSGLRLKVLNVAPGVAGPWDRDLNGDSKKETWERNLLVDVRDLQGNQIADDKVYKLATNSFLSGGGDFQKIVYDQVLQTHIQQFTGLLIRDVIDPGWNKTKGIGNRLHMNLPPVF